MCPSGILAGSVWEESGGGFFKYVQLWKRHWWDHHGPRAVCSETVNGRNIKCKWHFRPSREGRLIFVKGRLKKTAAADVARKTCVKTTRPAWRTVVETSSSPGLFIPFWLGNGPVSLELCANNFEYFDYLFALDGYIVAHESIRKYSSIYFVDVSHRTALLDFLLESSMFRNFRF